MSQAADCRNACFPGSRTREKIVPLIGPIAADRDANIVVTDIGHGSSFNENLRELVWRDARLPYRVRRPEVEKVKRAIEKFVGWLQTNAAGTGPHSGLTDLPWCPARPAARRSRLRLLRTCREPFRSAVLTVGDGVEHQFDSRRDAKLIEDSQQIFLDRVLAESQFSRNLTVA